MVDPVWEWLNADGVIHERGFATHGLAPADRPDALPAGRRLHWVEKKGKLESLKGWAKDRHFAFNVALGGVGEANPTSAATVIDRASGRVEWTPVAEDGLNGHVYVYYRPPTTGHEWGGLMIGCENAEHGAGTNPHTGCGHGLGGSQALSATGGVKFKAWAGAEGPDVNVTGLACDLTGFPSERDLRAWLGSDALSGFDPQDIAAPTNPVPPLPVHA
jgi:hypothetical protein